MVSLDKTLPLRPLHPLSAVVLATADWLGLGLNIITTMQAYWLVVAACTVSSTLGMGLIERRLEREPPRIALLKGGLLSALIAVPLPLAGGLAAFGLLIWWCAS
jgi:hypothetical protein